MLRDGGTTGRVPRGVAGERVKRAVCRFLPRRTSIAQFRSRHYTHHRTHSSSGRAVGWHLHISSTTTLRHPLDTHSSSSSGGRSSSWYSETKRHRSSRLGKTKLSCLPSHIYTCIPSHPLPSSSSMSYVHGEGSHTSPGLLPGGYRALGRGHY